MLFFGQIQTALLKLAAQEEVVVASSLYKTTNFILMAAIFGSVEAVPRALHGMD